MCGEEGVSCPQVAGLAAIATLLNGGGLEPINEALYSIASDPGKYASDFFDVTVGTNRADPSVRATAHRRAGTL